MPRTTFAGAPPTFQGAQATSRRAFACREQRLLAHGQLSYICICLTEAYVRHLWPGMAAPPQDFAYPSLDPTIYDLNSAYIDTMMMKDIVPTNVLQGGNSYDIKTGVLLPETQNIIYYNVVEDIFGNPDYDTDDLCDIQVGMTGIFAMLLGYELGLPPMFNTETGDPGVGFFGLIDHG